jgi:membrane-associated phospholipid phosphatase
MKFILHIISSLSPLILFFGGFIYSLFTQNPFGYYFSLVILLLGEGCGRFLKLFFQTTFPDSKWMERPDPNAPCTFFLTKHSSPSWGFPSGHSLTNSLGLTLISLYVWAQAHIPLDKSIFITLISIFFMIYVGWSRITLGCHNIYQVTGGILFGILLGIYSFYLYENIKNLDSEYVK